MATACYVPEYLPASYKGVPFDAIDASSEHGRRGAEGEFPFGETTGYADLGRRIRSYSLRGRFATNDHVRRAAALIAAVETPGPGPLIHPTRGVVIVACRSLKVTDSILEGQGVTYIDMDFVEGNSWANGFALGNLLQTGLSIASLIAISGESFAQRYTPRTAKPYNRDKVRATATTAIQQIRDEFHAAAVKGETTDQNVWSAIFDLDQRSTDVQVLDSAEETFRTMRLGMAAIGAELTGSDLFRSFLRLANANAKQSTLTGADGISQDAVYGTVRAIAAGYMTRGALDNQALNAQDAYRDFQQITAVLESEIEGARLRCDNNLYLELRNFYVGAQTALLNRVYNLPALVVYNFRKGVHSLVAAYEIYDDAKKAPTIENQNPGATPWAIGPEVVAQRA